MLNQMTSFFTSAFYFQGTNWKMILLAIVVGLVFGAIWLTLYRPPLFRQTQLWAVAIVSAILTWTAIAFVQVPLQSWYGRALDYFWNQNTIGQWMLLAGIPLVLLSGLVQEASKLAPVLIYWWHNGKRFTPKFGLIVGAVPERDSVYLKPSGYITRYLPQAYHGLYWAIRGWDYGNASSVLLFTSHFQP